jgi:hypothetical protein
MALLKILALSRKNQEQGRVKPAAQAFSAVRKTMESRRRS